MKVLVTGGSGFLGKNVVPLLREKVDVYAPYSKHLNMLNYEEALSEAKKYKPDVILHLAAKCGGILANKNQPADFLRDNTLMAINIYEMARVLNCSVYSLGSVCAYPKFCQVPFVEDDIWNGAAEETNFPYGQAKRTLMMLGQTYRSQYGIKGAHLIPVNMYGPHDHFDLVNSHVVPALINKFTTAVKRKLPSVQCWGTGEATRELFYIEDAATAIVKAVTSKLDTDLPINLGTGKDISIKDLAYLIGNLTGYNGVIEFTGEVSDGQPKRRLDVSRAKAMLDWEARTKLEDGLLKTIAWYLENHRGVINEKC